ncbi:hypothetical protein QJS66_19765 [Kocuria rhizophila]|nr:hypothetical protein QJS66_19765 [Kocuria rhizophila]
MVAVRMLGVITLRGYSAAPTQAEPVDGAGHGGPPGGAARTGTGGATVSCGRDGTGHSTHPAARGTDRAASSANSWPTPASARRLPSTPGVWTLSSWTMPPAWVRRTAGQSAGDGRARGRPCTRW